MIDSITNVVTAIIFFILGNLFNNYRIKHNNIREKIITLNTNTVKPLHDLIGSLINSMENGKYLCSDGNYNSFFQNNELKIYSIMEYSYLENFIITRTDVFEKSGGQLVVSYKADRILKRNGKYIIDSLNEYKDKLENFRQILPQVIKSPPQFVIDEIGYSLVELGRSIADLKGPQFEKDILIISLSVALNNPKFISDGHHARLLLQEKRLSELTDIYLKDTEYYALLKEFRVRNENVQNCLNSLKTNLENLHREWRDKYDI